MSRGYLPIDRHPIADLRSGKVTPPWALWFQELAATLPANLVNRGSLPAPTTTVGLVEVWPPQEYLGDGVIYAPDGTLVSTSGSTSSGLQEAINYACLDPGGFDLLVHGGGDQADQTPPSFGASCAYLVDGTLDIPAVQGKRITFDAATIAFGGITAEPCIRFDSFMMFHWAMHGGQVATTGRTGNLVLFDPRNPVPLDGTIGCIDSSVEFCAIAGIAAGAAQVRFRANTGDLSNLTFFANEINAGNTAIQIDTPTGGVLSVGYLRIICPHIHGQFGTDPAVRVGHAAGAANERIRDVYWNLHILHDPTGGGDGFFSRATRDRGFVALAGVPNTQYDVRFEDEAQQGDLMVSTDTLAADFATMVRDASAAQNNRVSGLRSARKTLTPSGSPYVYPADTDYELLPRDHVFTVLAGTVTAIEVSYDGGTTWDPTGLTAGVFTHHPGWRHQITYAVAPTMAAIL